MAYSNDISGLGADHHWKFDGNSNDAIGSANGTDTSIIYTDSAIAKDATNCATTNATTDRISIPTTSDIDGSAQTRWSFGGWFAVTGIQAPPKSIAGRGNTTQAIRFILFLGNNVMAEADPGGTDQILQVFGSTYLAPNRVYHLFARWSGSGYDNLFDFFLDGIKMTNAEPSDRQPDIASFPATSVLEFADPAGTVSVGGTEVILNAPVNGKFQHWATFNDADNPTDTEIRETLFERGALAQSTISSDTESNMQTAVNALGTSRTNCACDIEIEAVSGGGDFTLEFFSFTFDALASIHIRYNGTTDTLIIRDNGSTNLTTLSAPFGGSIKKQTKMTVKTTVKSATTGSVIQGARVLLNAASGGPLPYQESVSITRSGSTATVTHTAHGLVTGNKVLIEGADQNEYNGIHTITVTGTNTYTYTVSGTPATPATGTITSTSVILDDTTDVFGEVTGEIDFTSNQPVSGYARKASSSPYYKPVSYSGTITSSGLIGNILLIGDE